MLHDVLGAWVVAAFLSCCSSDLLLHESVAESASQCLVKRNVLRLTDVAALPSNASLLHKHAQLAVFELIDCMFVANLQHFWHFD